MKLHKKKSRTKQVWSCVFGRVMTGGHTQRKKTQDLCAGVLQFDRLLVTFAVALLVLTLQLKTCNFQL